MSASAITAHFHTQTSHTHCCFFYSVVKPGYLASPIYDVILSQRFLVGLSFLSFPSPVRIIFRQSPCIFLVLSYIDSLLSLTLVTLHRHNKQSHIVSEDIHLKGLVFLRIFRKYTTVETDAIIAYCLASLAVSITDFAFCVCLCVCLCSPEVLRRALPAEM